MRGKESIYPRDWLRIAEKDLSRVGNLIELQDMEAAGFYLQQAVEKFLKAYLLSKGWQLQRTHDLEALLSDAVSYDHKLEPSRQACAKISGFYLLDRYPLALETTLMEEEVRQARADVQGLIEKLRAGVARE